MSEQLFEGAIKVERFYGFGMLTIRGDFTNAKIKSVIEANVATVPAIREITVGREGMLAWMSPDELLAVLPTEKPPTVSKELQDGFGDTHSLVIDVSDARAVFRLTGKGVREVIAKGAPADLSEDAFGPGQIRRTRLGQVACAYWMSGPDQFDLICFRSVADFVFEWLSVASAKDSLPEHL